MVRVVCPNCGEKEKIYIGFYEESTECEGDYQKPVMQCHNCLKKFKKSEACFSDD